MFVQIISYSLRKHLYFASLIIITILWKKFLLIFFSSVYLRLTNETIWKDKKKKNAFTSPWFEYKQAVTLPQRAGE